ncbi:14312_t:CDS:1, partial [Dentiscutata erythropus]
MSISILKTHYRWGATILTPGQIEEIRYLKNKVPVYMIVNEYHINKNRVHDIWNDCERSQQNRNHFFEELRKVQSVSSVPPSENDPQEKENNYPIVGSLKSLDESITSELSSSSRTPLFSEFIETGGSLLDRVQEKQKKKKKSSKPKLVQ